MACCFVVGWQLRPETIKCHLVVVVEILQDADHLPYGFYVVVLPICFCLIRSCIRHRLLRWLRHRLLRWLRHRLLRWLAKVDSHQEVHLGTINDVADERVTHYFLKFYDADNADRQRVFSYCYNFLFVFFDEQIA